MQAKLTLTVSPDVIAAAKAYAAETGTSVSQLVEDYLSLVTSRPALTGEAPVLARLRGSLRGVDVDDYRRHLAQTYA
jgi:hypothetical protein